MPSSAPGAVPRSSRAPLAGAGTTAAGAAANARTRRGSSERPWSPPWRRPSHAEIRHVTIPGASTIRHVTKRGRLFCPQLRRPGRCRPRRAPRLLRRSRPGRRSGSAGACSLPRQEPSGRRRRPCSTPRTPCSRTLSHGDARTADQRDGLSHIAAAAAPHQPRTGGEVASRARIRDGGGTAARHDFGPSDGRSAPRSPLPSPPALTYEHNGESRSRRPARHVNPGE